ncbi:MAG: class IV adenylate cyclase [Patescibacteria group bacterium]|jgi:predicted adenylyl cyclase CyaB
MAQDNKETEIKIKIEDIDNFKNKLISLNPIIEEEKFERTIRFDTPGEELEKKGIFVRVRSGFKNVWTVKKNIKDAKDENKYFQRHEWEIEISDIETAREMMKVLGFEKEFIMEKYRSKYTLPDIEITIDRLPFGHYAELEGSKEAIDRLANILGINIEERITTTYWHLHDEYNIANNLSEQNIIFKT